MTGARRAALACLALLALAVAAPDALAANYSHPATYSGPAATGGTVEFDVSADGAGVTRFVILAVPTSCGTIPSSTTTGTIPIANDSFSYGSATTLGIRFSGSFPAAQQAQLHQRRRRLERDDADAASRHDPSADEHRLRPEGQDWLPQGEVPLPLQRGRLDLPVQARPQALGLLPLAEAVPQAEAGQAHLPGAGARRRRQRRPDAGEAPLARRLLARAQRARIATAQGSHRRPRVAFAAYADPDER
jgi:hypothetical protein